MYGDEWRASSSTTCWPGTSIVSTDCSGSWRPRCLDVVSEVGVSVLAAGLRQSRDERVLSSGDTPSR
jgi:hypothetical protein